MPTKIIVRTESESDRPNVFNVNMSAFGREKEARLVDALRSSDAFVAELSLVAEMGGKIVGYILFTKISFVNNPDHQGLAIGPVAVAADMQKRGIGKRLIEFGLQKARDLGFDSVILLGHPEYYPRFGFLPASNWHITTTYNAPEATFALELNEGSLRDIAGEARYAKEFALNDC